MRRWTAISCLLVIIMLAGAACSKQQEPKKAAAPPGHEKMVEEYRKDMEASRKIVVARVNGTAISKSDLIARMNQMAPGYIKDPQKASPEANDKLKKDAIDTLVFRELAVQEAVRQGMKAAPEAVEQRMKRLRAGFRTAEDYKIFLERAALTEEYLKKQIERDTLFDMIASKEIFQKVKVDERRVKETYEKEKKRFVVPESFELDDVFIPSTGQSDAAMNTAKETLALIKKNNDDLSKLPRNKGAMVRHGVVAAQEYPNIYKTASTLKPGEVSGIISESDGLHIVKFIGKEPPRPMTFEEAKATITRELMTPLVEKRKEEWEKELKKKAKIEILL